MSNPAELSAAAQRVQAALRAHGIEAEIRELAASTRTAQEAADAVGCALGQIAKSLIFWLTERDAPLLVITSGSNRVSEARVTALVGEPIAKARAEAVRQVTGYAIGGVPPLGHATSILTLIDTDLLRYEQIWAAAGTPNALFAINPRQLAEITGAQVAEVAE